MKKLFLTLVMLLTLAVASVASAAANGKILDAEESAAEKFFNSGNYKTAMSVMTAEMIGNWDEQSYNSMKSSISENFGKITTNRLRVVEKLDDAEVLMYQIVAEKMPAARFVYVFKLNGDVPRLQDFRVILPQPEQAGEGEQAAK